MYIPEEFNEIRPYTPEELPSVYEELIADAAFRQVVASVMPGVPFDALAQKLRACRTNLDFQKAFFYGLLWDLAHKAADSLTFDARALTDKTRNYTFISNHRDIILDSAFLSILLIDNGMNTVEIAIGDNLLIYPWIKKLVRINKSFIVHRGLNMRQQLEASALMARYMHFAIGEKHENVWIAQRQGRAKDSDDRTQDSVLKMMAMGGEGDVIDRLQSLNLVPLAISYEYDPCDYLKAQEMQQKRDDANFVKSKQDDLINMQTGLYGYKGNIHFQATACINEELEALRNQHLPKPALFPAIAQLIDRRIHAAYRLYPGNYVAWDELEGNMVHTAHYTADEKAKFDAYVEGQVQKVDLPDKDTEFLRACILKMYANPAINHYKALNNE
jgi:hypothetical protein